MEFSRQEYWSGLAFPIPEDFPGPGIKPAPSVAPALQADSLPLSHQRSGHITIDKIISYPLSITQGSVHSPLLFPPFFPSQGDLIYLQG